MIDITPNTASTETAKRVLRKTTKSVSFLSTVKVSPCLHINDYTKQEKKLCWFSSEEMSNIKNDIRESIHLLCENIFFSEEEEDICSRGLEVFMPQESAARRERRQDAIQAVLEEQQAQWDNNECFDDDLIAEAYQHFTTLSLIIARKNALRDEEFVQELRAKRSHSFLRNSISRKTSRSGSLTDSQQGSKRRLITQGTVMCIQ
ncbi:hypothetical protein IV203_003717 [Nitzschia inconspicua]|uniref:Uncharacterized protein n=1 Tax=Nitzschia inconspicua TaxID=303405 RepID=A0A9K3L406_9STRA|nr:hypothetical protein IV203_003717 [Nitzschia inconspicua]